ncbi:putative zinc finger A20 and AN1 domain-containing stress-associated protein 8 [Vicia villosa]|uniref:putative zinc finger A20 and AN1 domain-containing stress-associated protein 8 n=1 Tax=Vicia villosa TaxID=3911 RepID=UPI00273B933B|nr:putative zinc finger A20 and AN1 domain-containing stress-associated protein 8 [Vicia villosa]
MEPSLCANGCGFYGSPSNKNLCSKCFNQYVKENIAKFSENESTSSYLSKNLSTNDIYDGVEAISLNDNENMKKKKNRCKSCNKKVGLIGFECRCGDVFCGMHRYPEEHTCKVNLKNIGRQVLEKQNPLCMSDKLEHRI